MNDFINRYGVKNIQRSDRKLKNYYATASQQSYHYFDDRDDIVEIEMPYRCFTALVDNDSDFIHYKSVERQNSKMRKKHPEIQDAYERYQLMLALYR
jgi:hypothetical protein